MAGIINPKICQHKPVPSVQTEGLTSSSSMYASRADVTCFLKLDKCLQIEPAIMLA